jgi:hypothetical protein
MLLDKWSGSRLVSLKVCISFCCQENEFNFWDLLLSKDLTGKVKQNVCLLWVLVTLAYAHAAYPMFRTHYMEQQKPR